MKGSIPVKVGRLVANFALHPQYLPRTIRDNLINGSTPLDLGLPWFSYAAIDFLAKHLTPTMNVCEYGSGGSTLFFARRTHTVFSIEDNEKWFALVSQRLEELGLQNVQMKLCPFDFKNPEGFENSTYLHALPDRKFDVLVIDGSEEWSQVRPTCFQHAEAFIAPGGLIVVDDSWRYPGLRLKNRAKRHQVFKSVGPCRPGVTSTDIFFY
jgi:predicted O-methyltransferase YrrM